LVAQWLRHCATNQKVSGFGGLVVRMLASGPQDRGFEPEAVGFFG
jgi:hypothetical protein